MVRLPRIRYAIIRSRDAISSLPQGIGGHLSSQIVQHIIDLDSSLEHGMEVTDLPIEPVDTETTGQVVAALKSIVLTCEQLLAGIAH
jgi:hypothetical protein